jgi:tripartite-type tricarboxylate transporter receptor subunit TctC
VKRMILAAMALLSMLSSRGFAGQADYDEKAVASFYRGKTVTILVGHSAGGGFDTYARVISRHFGKHIPGNPNVLVNNMPGGRNIDFSESYLQPGAERRDVDQQF